MRVVILISGSGTNLQAIINACQQGLAIKIAAVISDQPEAYGLARAKLAAIPAHVINRNEYPNKKMFEHALQHQINAYSPQLIVLAGFMRALSADFVAAYSGHIINIHPSLLPQYPGLHTHEKVLRDQAREHGASIHFVTAQIDAGPIICQSKMPVFSEDTVDSLHKRVQEIEHRIYPQVLSWFAEKRIYLDANQQIYFDHEPLAAPILL